MALDGGFGKQVEVSCESCGAPAKVKLRKLWARGQWHRVGPALCPDCAAAQRRAAEAAAAEAEAERRRRREAESRRRLVDPDAPAEFGVPPKYRCYSFSSFRECPGNTRALAAARTFAGGSEGRLTLTGGVGVGKTHLAVAVGRVVYLVIFLSRRRGEASLTLGAA